jgi:hypothetical protein
MDERFQSVPQNSTSGGARKQDCGEQNDFILGRDGLWMVAIAMQTIRNMSVIGGKGGISSVGPRLLWLCLAGIFLSTTSLRAADTNLTEEVRLLREQNAGLQKQLQKQGDLLEALTEKVKNLETSREAAVGGGAPETAPGGFNFGKVNIGAEGGVAFFNTGREGFAPNSEFRVDEARLFIEAPIWKGVYFYGDVDLATRESMDLNLYLGELYLDFEDVSQLWSSDGQLNVRVGRMNIPFGEEYLKRNAIDDPLISHSLSDLWGFDPGVEIYGAAGKFGYVLAVQNGGGSGVQDFTGDKSVAGRISFDPNKHWHFSVSGMRTGDVSAQDEYVSAEWFGTGLFQSLGSPATTLFHANLVEGDVTARWASGHVSASGGYARYGDNDPGVNNGRDIFYCSIEGVQNLPRKFYAAARFSEIMAKRGVPVTGFGNGNYFSALAADMWRLSLGLGYRFSDRLVIKTEYSFEQGRNAGGGARDQENFFGTEAAFKF